MSHTLQRVRKPEPLAPGETKTALMLQSPKTNDSRRTLSLPAVAVSAFAHHRKRQDEDRLLCGSSWIQTDFVFTTSIGTPLDQKKLFREFRKLPAEAELPLMRFHDLRHSAATLLLAQGCHPRLIMSLLGHSSISLTMDTYSHVIEEMKKETAMQMDEILKPVDVNVAVKRPRNR